MAARLQDVIDVFHYMSKYGLPDESCMLYSATDHKKYEGACGRGPALHAAPLWARSSCRVA